MPTIEELRKQVWDLYVEPTPLQKEKFIKNAKSREDLEIADDEQFIISNFSIFNPFHQEKAAKVYNEFFKLADANSSSVEKGIEAVVKRYNDYKGNVNPDLLYYALSVFITHHTFGKVLTIPNILVREPELAMSSKFTSDLEDYDDTMGGASGEEGKLDWFREDPQQNEHHAHWHNVYPGSMNRNRQGEMFLYMHQQMLARYDVERIAVNLPRVEPFTFDTPIESGYNPGDFILAETDRQKREPNQVVDVTLNWVLQNGQQRSYTLQNHQAQKEAFKRAIENKDFQRAAGNTDDDATKISASDLLGRTIEPSGSPERQLRGFSNYHGWGHVLIAKSHITGDVDLNSTTDGVMAVPNTAIRDSVFYRWHKHIDDHSFELQEQYGERDFNDAPAVSFDHKTVDDEGEPLSADIVFCLNKDVPGLQNPDFDGASFGEHAFGGDNWDKDFSKGEYQLSSDSGDQITFKTTDTLLTSMNKGTIQFEVDGAPTVYEYDYLNHEPFSYYLKIRNNGNAKTVTCRMFMVPEGIDPETNQPYAENRRLWIELDKVFVDLKRNSKSVFFQFDRKSSVIRKPAQMDIANINLSYTPSEFDIVTSNLIAIRDGMQGGNLPQLSELLAIEETLKKFYRKNIKTSVLDSGEQSAINSRRKLENLLPTDPSYVNVLNEYVTNLFQFGVSLYQSVPYCDCGWPYNLFLPRGTQEGMKFKLMVMATDAAQDVEEIGCCGSMSYCGAKDTYPDLRPMGYPFDRKLPDGAIVDTLNALPNVAFRTIKIQCTNLNEYAG